MASKIKKKTKKRENEGLIIVSQLLEYIFVAVACALCIFVPLYVKNGYYGIGDAKFECYKYIAMIGLSCCLLCAAFYGIIYITDSDKRGLWKEEGIQKMLRRLSITDYFAISFLIATLIATVAGGFYSNAFWGYPGWFMGIFSQFSFVLLYFFASRVGKYYNATIWVLCFTATIVFSLGVLNRMMIDPLGYYEGIDPFYQATFLSTLGQVSWYASFMVFILPIGIWCVIFAEKKYLIMIGSIFTFLGYCTLVTQNGDSAFFGLFAALLIYFWFAIKEPQKLMRFFISVSGLFFVGRFMSFVHKFYPNTAIYYYDFITNLLINHYIGWILGVIFLIPAIVLFVLKDKWDKYPVALFEKIRLVVAGIVAIGVIFAVATIVLNAHQVFPQSIADKLNQISYFVWDDRWGNGRGQTWAFTVQMYGDYSFLHKVFGVGPDCYYNYASTSYLARLQQMWGDKALTNAHNEWMNMLVNVGLLGAITYLGIFVSAIKNMIKNQDKQPFLLALAAAVLAYMAYNFFCYQQVLCTPFIFMFMGFGEYIRRKKSDN